MEYAVILTGGKQYLVSPGETIEIEKIEIGVNNGQQVVFDQVALYTNGETVQVGTPLCNVKVIGNVIENFRDKKKVGGKHISSSYRRTFGHRQHKTRVEIKEIQAHA